MSAARKGGDGDARRNNGGGPLSVVDGGVLLRVKATPKARRAEIGGLLPDAQGGTRLIVKVTAPADQGKANVAVIALLADRLGLAASRLELIQGASSREKTLRIEADAQIVADALKLDYLDT